MPGEAGWKDPAENQEEEGGVMNQRVPSSGSLPSVRSAARCCRQPPRACRAAPGGGRILVFTWYLWQHTKHCWSSRCVGVFHSAGMLQRGRSISNSIKTNKSRPSPHGLMLDAKVES